MRRNVDSGSVGSLTDRLVALTERSGWPRSRCIRHGAASTLSPTLSLDARDIEVDGVVGDAGSRGSVARIAGCEGYGLGLVARVLAMVWLGLSELGAKI